MLQAQGRRARAILKSNLAATVLFAPLMASAQFSLVSQSAHVEAYAYPGYAVDDTAPTGATGNLSLHVIAGDYNTVTSNANVDTTVESGRIGLSVGVGGSSFDRNFAWTCGTTYYSGDCVRPSATSTARGELYFDVSQSTQVAVDVWSAYSGYTSGRGFPFAFEKLAADGNWVSVGAPGQVKVIQDYPGFRNNFTGELALDEGHYRMAASYYGSNVWGAPSYSWGGAYIKLTAVPEAGSMVMMGMGLMALSLLKRGKRRQARTAA
ncbi:MAG TPA: PEP-CTERM sorting domain-containing protein [Aquabacterium sp.]|uniref:PEP-CTERM sorting domain-containing protein n=1 Tax=Aquabacterium sp. TaxID=1872578 RepID=UPI002E3005AB|nr:PEP-CTERM sorting domain-containing protein [Aquabacterium sp.]HEX5357222.1 PEP-CTERM sorting domain-containing protein [Aquabacterium sp.]